MSGSKVKLWKQDPSVESIGIRSSYIFSPVDHGPKDSQIEIMDMPEVQHDANRDFIFDPVEDPIKFDAVHTFTVIRQVLTMFQRALLRTEILDDFTWQWGNSPILVYPRAGIDANAYYSRYERSLKFYHFHPDNNETNPMVYTCRSFDIVAHETGHAILDALRPGYWGSMHPQTGALHEAFGDLTAILTMLAQMDQCEAIIAESKADLHTKTFFSAVGEEFGEAIYNRTTGLRNADNDLKLSEVGTQVHSLSQVFTGAVYDIMADMFNDYVKFELYDPAETLFKLGKHLTSLIIIALYQGPDHNATFVDIANKMIEIEPVEHWKEFIRNRFEEREVFDMSFAGNELIATPAEFEGACTTLNNPENWKTKQR